MPDNSATDRQAATSTNNKIASDYVMRTVPGSAGARISGSDDGLDEDKVELGEAVSLG